MVDTLFKDRHAAGRQLITQLGDYKNQPNTIVLGLPRGGVVVAAEIAKDLQLPLDIIVTRKIGAPFSKELAIGAISADGATILDERAQTTYDVPASYIAAESELQQQEAQRRVRLYRGKRPPLDLKGKIVLLVDDGLATGLTMEAAVAAVRKQQPAHIVLVAPVGAQAAVERLRSLVDAVVVPHLPVFFGAIGEFYRDFSEVNDDTVIAALAAPGTWHIP